jgi:hypothetical protein
VRAGRGQVKRMQRPGLAQHQHLMPRSRLLTELFWNAYAPIGRFVPERSPFASRQTLSPDVRLQVATMATLDVQRRALRNCTP